MYAECVFVALSLYVEYPLFLSDINET
jgi:hypothetical protein